MDPLQFFMETSPPGRDPLPRPQATAANGFAQVLEQHMAEPETTRPTQAPQVVNGLPVPVRYQHLFVKPEVLPAQTSPNDDQGGLEGDLAMIDEPHFRGVTGK